MKRTPSSPSLIKPLSAVLLLSCLAPLAAIAAGATGAVRAQPEPPVIWTPPASFDLEAENLGLPILPSVQHITIYNPEDDQPIQTFNNQPASQGWLNHHPNFLQLGDHLIVTWTSHLTDENAPGQRLLARTALITKDGELEWAPNVVELAPPPVEMKPRSWDSHPAVIDSPYLVGRLMIIDGRIFFKGSLRAYDGWSNIVKYHGDQKRPVPAEHYRASGNPHGDFKFDIRRDLRMRCIQAWEFKGNELVPASPMYLIRQPVQRVEVTPGVFKPVIPMDDTYGNAASITTAPEYIQAAVHAEPDVSFERSPNYAAGTAHLAADGHDGLAHWAEFQRPDGEWVVLRDNLTNRGFYYAATKSDPAGNYPPAVRTNMFGDVDPEAGELPDGKVWVLGNDRQRVHLYLTLSDDGIHFDKTWLLRKERLPLKPGLGKSSQPNGPQYPKALLVGNQLVVIYSIGKQNIAASTIPLSALGVSEAE